MPALEPNKIEFDGESFCVDAALVAEGLGLGPSLLRTLMRQGVITSRCERGVDDDAGRHRLTFFHGTRRLRLLVDDSGSVVERHFDSTPRSRAHASSTKRR